MRGARSNALRLIITPMGSSPSPPDRDRADQPPSRLDRPDPYLRLQHVTIFVRDQDRSLRFYVEQLGFRLVFDSRFPSGGRWVLVAPPDGTALLALIAPKPGSEEYKLIGRATQVVFLTEDVIAKFHEWRKRGVRFHSAPRLKRLKLAPRSAVPSILPGEPTPTWGGVFARFKDVDGNSFWLVGIDDVSREIEAQRRATAEKLESERRAARELEIAKQVQATLFPQRLPPLKTLHYAGNCIPARAARGDYHYFLDR